MRSGLAYILDGNPDEGIGIARIAQRCGMASRTFFTTQAFLDAVDQMPPSHIVLDLMMPDIDGVETICRLGEAASRARFIIISDVGSRVMDAAERLAMTHGLALQGTLTKPYDPGELAALFSGAASEPASDDGEATIANDLSITGAALREALTSGAVSVVYQPKIDCTTGEAIGVETLAAWHRPDGTRVPPELFVTLAERSNLIDVLTWHVVDQALDWLAALRRPDLSLAINVSTRSLENATLVSELVDRCRDRNIPTEQIVLEMTETAAMEDPLLTLDVLTRLRLRGFQVSIDDFGVGYSSIAQLARLPFSEIKVDRAFVRRLATHTEAHSIVNAIVSLGHSLGLVVAAEGVEDAKALESLRAFGCNHAQGFHIAPPLTPAEAAVWLTARTAKT